MKGLLVLLFTAVFAAQMLTGCGQKQEAGNKAPVIKPMEATSGDEESDTDEEKAANSMPAAAGGLSAKTVTESAIDKASAIQESQSRYEVQTVAVTGQAPASIEAPKPSETLILADFNSGEKPNNVGGNFGAWNKDPSDPTQWCKESFDNIARRDGKGFSMKLDYSVDSPNPAYNGFWMMLSNIDASRYDTLSLWIKGDSQAGYTTVLKIEIKNANKQVGRYYISNINDQWQQISIPLSEFKGLIDKTSLTEFVIVFEDRMATNKKGVVYIDDVAFTKK